jgi:hypothetical protein
MIQLISRGPVPTSGAGTSTLKEKEEEGLRYEIWILFVERKGAKLKVLNSYPGPMNFFWQSSIVYRRVIRSNCSTVYFLGSILIPPLAPPKGTSTTAHLNVIRAAKAR